MLFSSYYLQFKRFKYWVVTFLVISINACVQDPQPTQNNAGTIDFKHGVLVANEGPKGLELAELTYYNSQTNEVVQNYFKRNNPTLKLGDLANDICVIKYLDKAQNKEVAKCVVAVAGSGFLQVIDLANGENLGRVIFPKNSYPNRVSKLNDSLILVSSNTADNISIVNINSFTIMKTTETPPAPEAMAIADGKIFCVNSGYGMLRQNEKNASTISVYSLQSLEPINTIKTAINPTNIEFMPCCGKLYVQSVSINNFNSKLLEYDIFTMKLEREWDFKQGFALRHPFVLDTINQIAYLVGENEIFRLNLYEQTPELKVFKNNCRNVTAVGLFGTDVYFSEIDATASGLGTVTRVDNSGKIIFQFDAGLYPGAFGFY